MKFLKIGLGVGLILFVATLGFWMYSIHGNYTGSCDNTPVISFDTVVRGKYDCGFTEYTRTQITKPNAEIMKLPILAFPIVLIGAPALIGLLADLIAARTSTPKM
jgi:hypothetical protein